MWRHGQNAENLQLAQFCLIPRGDNDPSDDASQLSITLVQVKLTEVGCKLTSPSVEISCASLAEAEDKIAQLTATNWSQSEPSDSTSEWIPIFGFDLSSEEEEEGGIGSFPLAQKMPEILPPPLCPSLNPLLHGVPLLAGIFARVELILQRRRHRDEAHILRRRLLGAIRREHVAAQGDCHVATQGDRHVEGHPLAVSDRRGRKRGLVMRDEVVGGGRGGVGGVGVGETVGERRGDFAGVREVEGGGERGMEREVERELEMELGRLLNRHRNHDWGQGTVERINMERVTSIIEICERETVLRDERNENLDMEISSTPGRELGNVETSVDTNGRRGGRREISRGSVINLSSGSGSCST